MGRDRWVTSIAPQASEEGIISKRIIIAVAGNTEKKNEVCNNTRIKAGHRFKTSGKHLSILKT